MVDRSDLKTVDHGLFSQSVSFVRFDDDKSEFSAKWTCQAIIDRAMPRLRLKGIRAISSCHSSRSRGSGDKTSTFLSYVVEIRSDSTKQWLLIEGYHA